MMFGKLMKHIVTALVILGCFFVGVIGIVCYGFVMEDLELNLRNSLSTGVVKEVYAVPIGDTYDGDVIENGKYYEVYITFENTGNYAIDNLAMDLSFVQFHPEYGDTMVAMRYPLEDMYGSQYCIPAGKEGILKRIIKLKDDFESVRMIYTDEYTKEEQVVLEIRER